MKRAILTLFALLSLVLLTGCEGEQESHSVTEADFVGDFWAEIRIFYMDGARNRREGHYQNLAAEAMDYARYMEGIFSRFVEGTDVWRLNHANGEFVEVHPYLIQVLDYSLYFREATGGRMDITIGAVRDLWVFEANPEKGIDVRVPTQEELALALPTVGTGIIIDGNRVRLQHPQASLDLGGIAKGFMSDRVADFLRDAGVTSAIVSMGGDNVAIGRRLDGNPFGMGIGRPGEVALVHGHMGIAMVSDASMNGSGIDHRSFERDGVLYHHILDVDTGMPVDTDIINIYIVAPTSVIGEWLTTAVYTLGTEAGLALVESIPNTHAVLIIDTGRDDGWQLWRTSGVGLIQRESDFVLYFE
ncbi:MAG: FAD:protein FMN transferase [Defluviitaleaceae bacterium]|nr:FAD:protein FMN transferase [Defluviitaleaceae bacterium]